MTVHITTPKGEVNVRIATLEDASSLLELRLEALAMHPEAFAADANRTAADGENAWMERINEYATTKSGAIMMACLSKELIGMGGIVRGHWPKTQHSSSLWGVYVKPDWRGFHIAVAIINECITWAQEHEIVVVKLAVITINTSAIRCYTRCGFKVYGTEPRTIFFNGVYYDELLMAKML
jgi:RimJ/RimL family protein N-acetyltransferase